MQRTVRCLLFVSMVYAAPSAAADSVSCSVSALKNLMALDRKVFEARQEALTGSTEGGELTILSRRSTPQRARMQYFGETGNFAMDAGYLNGDLMATARWTEYAEPLPRPVRTKKVDTLAGFVCSGVLILDRQGSADVGKDRVTEFEQRITSLLDDLKSRGIAWSVQLPSKK
jgi:hypothetical protein